MPTLLLSTRSLPAGPALADAARLRCWPVCIRDESCTRPPGPVVYYGGSDVALTLAAEHGLALLDLLARLPAAFLQRTVEFGRFRDLSRLRRPTFVKPADPVAKVFDAGIYSDVGAIRVPRGVSPDTQVLVADPVGWLAEYRLFVLEGKVAASSPYVSFGRPVWRPFGTRSEPDRECDNARRLCERLLAHPGLMLPPAFVVDVGLIEERGWAVVEFNPAWCAGVLGADPKRVLDVLERASRPAVAVSAADHRWLVSRPRTGT